jgi:RNase P/RNase MRP subunit POP5
VEFRDGSRCTVEIESLKVSGTIRPAARLASAMAWIEANPTMLLAQWKGIVQ